MPQVSLISGSSTRGIAKIFPEPRIENVDDVETGVLQTQRHDDSCNQATMPNIRVLLVDDSFMNRKIVRRMLDAEGCMIFDVVEADDGVEAFATIRDSMDASTPFDLVLIDSVMKVKHGPETVEDIRKELGFRGLIVGLTGNALPEDIANFKAKVWIYYCNFVVINISILYYICPLNLHSWILIDFLL